MKIQEIKFKNKKTNIRFLLEKIQLIICQKKLKNVCPKTKKIAIIIDNNVPGKFKKILKKYLKIINQFFFILNVSEKSKSINM